MYKRYSSVIPSSHILDEVQEVQPGTDKAEVPAPDGLAVIQRSSGGEFPKASPVLEGPSSTSVAPKVQLRNQRIRHVSRPVSMPLERLPAPLHSERNNRYASPDTNSNVLDPVSETIQETPETEKARQSISSRVSTYYITPFIDTQSLQRRTWDRKYKHYDVTPRTAMIVANLPPASSGIQPVKSTLPVTVSSAATTATEAPTTTTMSTVFPNNSYTVPLKSVRTFKGGNETTNSVSEPRSSPKLPLTLRQPRTLQPPPGTFYKPPASTSSRAGTLPNWTTTVTTTNNTTTNSTSLLSPTKPAEIVTRSPVITRPQQTQLQAQDSNDSAIDPGLPASSTMSPPQSPPPSSPEDLSHSEIKPVYQRLRSRQLQELEQREAHFVWSPKNSKAKKEHIISVNINVFVP